MKALVVFLEQTTRSVGLVAALLTVPLALAMGYEVIGRYVFNAPTFWAYELGYMIMGVHFLLGSAYTLQRGGHVRVDLLYAHLSARKKAWVDLLGYTLLALPFLVMLTYSLWGYAYAALESGERTGASAWSPLIWPIRMFYVAAFALLAMQVLAEILKALSTIMGRNDTEQGN